MKADRVSGKAKTASPQLEVQDGQPQNQALDTIWMTASEAANYLKVKVRTLQHWTRARKIKAYALSGCKRHVWRYRREDLDNLLFASSMVSSESPSVL